MVNLVNKIIILKLTKCSLVKRGFDKKALVLFTVFTDYDLNKYPTLKQPYGLSDEKVVCCGPCKSDPVIFIYVLDSHYLIIEL